MAKAPDFVATGATQWAVYASSPDAAYASDPCGYFVVEVSFQPNSHANEFIALNLAGADDSIAKASKASCEAVTSTLHVLLGKTRVAGEVVHGTWSDGKCELFRHAESGSLPQKPYRILARRTVNGQPVPVGLQVKQVNAP